MCESAWELGEGRCEVCECAREPGEGRREVCECAWELGERRSEFVRVSVGCVHVSVLRDKMGM